MKKVNANISERDYRIMKDLVEDYEFLTISNLVAYAVQELEFIDKENLEELNEYHRKKKAETRLAFMGASKFQKGT